MAAEPKSGGWKVKPSLRQGAPAGGGGGGRGGGGGGGGRGGGAGGGGERIVCPPHTSLQEGQARYRRLRFELLRMAADSHRRLWEWLGDRGVRPPPDGLIGRGKAVTGRGGDWTVHCDRLYPPLPGMPITTSFESQSSLPAELYALLATGVDLEMVFSPALSTESVTEHSYRPSPGLMTDRISRL